MGCRTFEGENRSQNWAGALAIESYLGRHALRRDDGAGPGDRDQPVRAERGRLSFPGGSVALGGCPQTAPIDPLDRVGRDQTCGGAGSPSQETTAVNSRVARQRPGARGRTWLVGQNWRRWRARGASTLVPGVVA